MENRIKTSMEAMAYIGSEYDFDSNILNIMVPSGGEPKLLVVSIKLWECVCNMILSLIEAKLISGPI